MVSDYPECSIRFQSPHTPSPTPFCNSRSRRCSAQVRYKVSSTVRGPFAAAPGSPPSAGPPPSFRHDESVIPDPLASEQSLRKSGIERATANRRRKRRPSLTQLGRFSSWRDTPLPGLDACNCETSQRYHKLVCLPQRRRQRLAQRFGTRYLPQVLTWRRIFCEGGQWRCPSKLKSTASGTLSTTLPTRLSCPCCAMHSA